MLEQELQDRIIQALSEDTAGDQIIAELVTFEDAGVMTRNSGLVVREPDGGEFQVTIVRSKWGHEPVSTWPSRDEVRAEGRDPDTGVLVDDDRCECGGEYVFDRDTCDTKCDRCGKEI